MIRALDDGAHAFARLASAARTGQRTRYHDAARAADAARGHVGAALDDLTDAGYRVKRPSSAAIPTLAKRRAKKTHIFGPAAPVATATPQATVQPTRTAVPHVAPKPTPIPAKPTPVPAKPTPQPIDG